MIRSQFALSTLLLFIGCNHPPTNIELAIDVSDRALSIDQIQVTATWQGANAITHRLPPSPSGPISFPTRFDAILPQAGAVHLLIEGLSGDCVVASGAIDETAVADQTLDLTATAILLKATGGCFGDGGTSDLATRDSSVTNDAAVNDLSASMLVNGQSCSSDGQCISGNCQTAQSGRVCAAVACGPCKVADPTGAFCQNALVNTDPKSDCVANTASCTAAHCDGQGACAPLGAGIDCATPTCANSGMGQPMSALLTTRQCDGVTTHCPAAKSAPCPNSFACADATSCKSACANDGDCVYGNYCNAGSCAPRQANGSGCSFPPQCQSFNCVSGVCRDCGMSGQCPPNKVVCSGDTCVACIANTDCSSVQLGSACSGGACTCSSDTDCQNPRAGACSGGVCSCGGSGAVCPLGQACTARGPSGICKGAPGTPCNAASDCATNNCSAGRCG